MKPLLVDSDALIHMRKLSLWQLLLACPEAALQMTSYAARHECVSLQHDIESWQRAGRLAIHDVVARTPAHVRFKAFKAEVDKGEAEALAWAREQPEAPVFVSCDGVARRFARRQGIEAWHLGDIARWLLASACAREEDLRAKLQVWEDPSQQIGRPPDWPGLDLWP